MPMHSNNILITFLLVIVPLHLSAATPLDCTHALKELAYRNGERTHLHRTPAEYFASARVGDRPRLVLTVGLPGSGKSHWVATAKTQGWAVISLDELRHGLAVEKRLRQEVIRLKRGIFVFPNPNNTEHVLALTREAGLLATRLFFEAVDRGLPVVWDGVNSMAIFRGTVLMQARECGYFTEALVFDSDDASVNAANIAKRVQSGGHDIVVTDNPAKLEAARRSELLALQQQLAQQPIRSAPASSACGKASRIPEEPATPLTFLAGIDALEENDFVDHIERVKVYNWTLPSDVDLKKQ